MTFYDYVMTVAIPALCWLMQAIHKHYATVRKELRVADGG
ncbi:MAG: hypothetical protein QOC58_1214, partial [Mycobacterium sp.]|nr:hypothetical protein [Mycobacterium sp.]